MSGIASALFWLLLPIAAGSGWWAARWKWGGRSHRNARWRFTPDYFRGLDYVLNDQPDRAIEEFIRVLEMDSDAAESCLMLGKLFRRSGELDRAIRVHQSLLSRPSLLAEQRLMVKYELGIDYLRSGLLDRAENLFKEIIEVSGGHVPTALWSLLEIYQQEHEWSQAIHYGHRLADCASGRVGSTLAHFYCEQAEVHYSLRQKRSTQECLRKALLVDPRCVRVSLIEARMFCEQNDPESALQAYLRVDWQDVDYLPEIASSLLDCYIQLGRREEGLEYLRAAYTRKPDIKLLKLCIAMIAESEGHSSAQHFLATELPKTPSVNGMELLLSYAGSDPLGGDSLRVLREISVRLADHDASYKCGHCGFVVTSLYWQCPGCKRWGVIKPIVCRVVGG